MNRLDRLIAWFDPAKGVSRARSRTALEVVRSYEGASRGRRLANWAPPSTNANSETTFQLQALRDRSRDLVRNNAWASRSIQVIANNVVGTGILPQASARNKAASRRLQALWEQWGDTLECDADGRNNFYGLEALVMRTVAESGECLIRRRWRKDDDGLSVPMQLQILEPDYLDVFKDGQTATGYIIQGIEFDKIGRRVGYWLYPQHPGGRQGYGLAMPSARVDATDILHVYRADRPGQVRGVPWCAPAIVKLRDLADYEDALLLRQKLSACFTAFVTEPEGVTGGTASIAESLEPGAIEILPPGKSIEFASPPAPSGTGEYTVDVQRAIAAAFGITFESMTGNMQRVNFSSGRMGWIEMHRNVEAWQWHMLVPQMCSGVWGWFCDAAETKGYTRTAATWTPPRREMIDPSKEIRATIDAIRAGLMSLSEGLRKLGYDPETVLNEKASDQKLLDSLGLTLDSDPRADKGRNDSSKDTDSTEEDDNADE